MKYRERLKTVIRVYNAMFNKNFKHIHEVIEAVQNDFIFDKAYRAKILSQISDIIIDKQKGANMINVFYLDSAIHTGLVTKDAYVKIKSMFTPFQLYTHHVDHREVEDLKEVYTLLDFHIDHF